MFTSVQTSILSIALSSLYCTYIYIDSLQIWIVKYWIIFFTWWNPSSLVKSRPPDLQKIGLILNSLAIWVMSCHARSMYLCDPHVKRLIHGFFPQPHRGFFFKTGIYSYMSFKPISNILSLKINYIIRLFISVEAILRDLIPATVLTGFQDFTGFTLFNHSIPLKFLF